MKNYRALAVGIAVFALGGGCDRRDMIYSPDISDAEGLSPISNHIAPIGDCGRIEQVLDFRGFVPISVMSKTRLKAWPKLGSDNFQYYQLPTRKAVAAICGRDEDDGALAQVPIYTESRLKGEDLEWAKAAYALTSLEKGELVYERLVGTGGYEDSMPVCAILNSNSVFIVLNFRSTGLDRHGTGQSLFALEFSRHIRGLRGISLLSSTGLNKRQTAAVMRDIDDIASIAWAMP